jgi:hypothetical protein
MRIPWRFWVLASVSTAFLCGATATAMTPFGPPRATIGAGRWAVGADYGRQSMDMQSFGTYREGYPDGSSYLWYCKYNRFEMKELNSNMIFGKLGYGIGDTWDIFGRIGVSDTKGDLLVSSVGSDGPASTDFFQGGERFSLDSSFSLAWGAGTRMTFAETGDIAWGTILQMTWLNPKGSESTWTDPLGSYSSINASIDLQYWEIQLAAGPTLNLGSVWLYGGPFLYFAKGDVNVQGTWTDMDISGPIEAKHDVREDSNFGGFGGMQVNLADNLCFYLEGQTTGDGWGFGAGGVWRLN